MKDALGTSEVDIGRGEIVDALVVATMIVVLDEGIDCPLEVSRQIVVFEQDVALQG